MPPVFSMFCSGPIFPERIVLAGVVTLASGMQLAYFARCVYKSREKHNISLSATTGHPEFERTLRAQQSVMEWHGGFLANLWVSTLFFHQVPAAICGLLYLICRHRYFNAYCRSEEERVPAMKMGGRVMMVMVVMSAAGVVRTVVSLFRHRHHFRHHGGFGAMFGHWKGGHGVAGGEGYGPGGPSGPGGHPHHHGHGGPGGFPAHHGHPSYGTPGGPGPHAPPHSYRGGH